MDSLMAIELNNSTTTPNSFLSVVVGDCRYLMERFELCLLKHIFREENGCADILTKTVCDQQLDFLFFSNAPAHVLKALTFDVSNATRLCLINA